jgi:polyisoprenoid-binding protein YceI
VTVAATRVVDGVDLPAPGVWEIDPGHAEVAFIGRHFMLTKVRGRFTDVSGEVVVAEAPADSRLDVLVRTDSLATGNDTRDEHLRSAELFDVASHPTAHYRSTAIRWQGSRGTVTGDLTLHGVTRPVTLDVEYVGHAADPWGGDRAVFSATATLDREDFGITWNLPLDTGGLLVSKDIRVEIEVETVLRRPDADA